MNPFYFGTQQRRLFGAYSPGSTSGPGARAVVLCHPWGQEYLRAHRSMRHLANMLARADVHVLRFDYFGTGDSAGEITDAELAGWEADIELALEELRDTTGAARVGLAGLRLGATLAAAVAARRPDDVDRLALWDPVVRGEEYAAELARAASGKMGDGTLEVLGFRLTPRMAGEIAAADLVALGPALPQPTLVVASAPLAAHGHLREALASRGRAEAKFEEVEAPPVWLEETDPGALPVPVLQRIVQWLT